MWLKSRNPPNGDDFPSLRSGLTMVNYIKNLCGKILVGVVVESACCTSENPSSIPSAHCSVLALLNKSQVLWHELVSTAWGDRWNLGLAGQSG